VFEAFERYGNITTIYGNITVCYGPNFTGKLAVTFIDDFFIIAVCLLLEIFIVSAIYLLVIIYSESKPSRLLDFSCS